MTKLLDSLTSYAHRHEDWPVRLTLFAHVTQHKTMNNQARIFSLTIQAHILRGRPAYRRKFGFLFAYIVGRGWLPAFIDYVTALG
jgi:hypothetical protein